MSNTFESIKYQVANIQFHFLEMNQEKTAIEANPSTHRIAQYIEILLKEKEGEIETLKAENSKMRQALEIIANWRLPPTGKVWDNDNAQPVSFEAEYGSNGVRDYIKQIATEALKTT